MTKRTDWFRVLYTSLFYAGIIMLLFSMLIKTASPTNIVIVTYTILGITLGLIATQLYLKMNVKLGMLESITTMTYVVSVARYMGPVFVVLAILSYSLFLNIRYRKVIDEKRTSAQYYTFSRMSLFITLIQMIVLFNGIETPKFKTEHIMPPMYNSGIYLTGVVNAFAVLIMGYILTSYTTDGFSLRKSLELIKPAAGKASSK